MTPSGRAISWVPSRAGRGWQRQHDRLACAEGRDGLRGSRGHRDDHSVRLIALWVPIYARSLPKLGDFPFFYWYQLILVPVTAILSWLCHLLLRTKPATPTARHREGVRR
jgi:hypothetical protein